MTPNPILKVLFTFKNHKVKCLLIGGQACIIYGAIEFSRDSDKRPLLDYAIKGDLTTLSMSLSQEEQIEHQKDMEYWRPLHKELEMLRHGKKP